MFAAFDHQLLGHAAQLLLQRAQGAVPEGGPGATGLRQKEVNFLFEKR